MPTPLSIILILVAGVLLHNGLVYLANLTHQRRDPIILGFGVLCLLGASYAMACLLVQLAGDAETYLLRSRVMAVLGRLIMVIVPWYVAYFTGYCPRRFLMALSSVFLFIGILDATLPDWLLNPHSGNAAFHFHLTPWGERIASWAGPPSTFVYLLYAGYLGVIGYTMASCRQLFRKGERARAWALAGVVAFSVLTYVNDTLLDANYIQSFYLEEYGIFAFIVMVGTAMGTRRLRAEGNYRALFHSVNDPIFVHDAASGQVLDVNDAAVRTYGAPREDLIKGSFDRLSSMNKPYTTEAALSRIQRAAKEAPQVFEWEARRVNDGSRFWVEVALRSEVIDGRKVVLATVRDITYRKRSEERLRDTQKLESLGVLAGGVAHDFNNLLTSILGHADLACQDLPPGSPVRASLDSIQRASHQAADLCRQLLAYSGKGRFVIGPVNLRDVVDEMTRILNVSMPEGIALTAEVSGHAAPIQADGTQIRQVAMNLIINAGEAMQGRAGAVHVSVGQADLDRAALDGMWASPESAPGSFAFVEVTDQGCGMDASTKARIFEPFFSTKFTGRGLGMAAVLGIVWGHKGAIGIESVLDQGTTVKAYFPAV